MRNENAFGNRDRALIFYFSDGKIFSETDEKMGTDQKRKLVKERTLVKERKLIKKRKMVKEWKMMLSPASREENVWEAMF